LTHQDGRRSALMVSASPLWSDANQLLGCVVMMTDITSHKLAEAALERQAQELAQSNSDLRQFAYSASHDLREPLRQLAVFGELIQQRFADKLGPEGKILIGHAVGAAHGMEKLVADLLAYIQAADAPQQDQSSADPNRLIEKIRTTFAELIQTTNARIEFEPLPLLPVHEVHLLQLLQNVIGNALKYRSDLPPLIYIRAERVENMWRMSVEDNGIGIQPDYQAKIFGLFQRLHGGGKYSGSGIGLAICQKIVHRYGGRIWVESEPGRGAKFVFTLPGEPQ
jgi:light-regulated signal transduction histidine kinase (bacteriophytochrome)